MKTRKWFPAGREDYLFRSSTSSRKSSVEGTKNWVLHLHSNPLVPFSELGIPDGKSCSIYRHSPLGVNMCRGFVGMCRPERVWCLGLFCLKTGIHFAYFGLELGMVFERSTWAYMNLLLSFQFQINKNEIEICELEMHLKNDFVCALI